VIIRISYFLAFTALSPHYHHLVLKAIFTDYFRALEEEKKVLQACLKKKIQPKGRR